MSKYISIDSCKIAGRNPKVFKARFNEKYNTFSLKKLELYRINEIFNAAYGWDETTIYRDSKDREHKLLYQLIYDRTQFKLNNSTEKLLFYMIVIDPDFKLLNIYMEENDKDSIKKRCLDEKIHYDALALELEKLYNKVFNVVEDPFDIKPMKKIITK